MTRGERLTSLYLLTASLPWRSPRCKNNIKVTHPTMPPDRSAWLCDHEESIMKSVQQPCVTWHFMPDSRHWFADRKTGVAKRHSSSICSSLRHRTSGLWVWSPTPARFVSHAEYITGKPGFTFSKRGEWLTAHLQNTGRMAHYVSLLHRILSG